MRANRVLKDWLIATRPWSFTASVMPVLATLAYLSLFACSNIEESDSAIGYDWINGLLSLVMIMLLHGGGNLVSDYYDNIWQVDLPGCLNGVRTMESGLFRPREIFYYGLSLLLAGAVTGLVILFRSSFEAVWIGILALMFPLAYPWMKAKALGDVNILFSFAIIPALGVSFVVTGRYHYETMLLCIPYGLLTVAILHANNTRDRANDRRAGLDTLPLLIGWKASRCLYVAELILPYILVSAIAVYGMFQVPACASLFLVFLSLPLAFRNIKIMIKAVTEDSQGIATLDKMSAQLQLTFGLIYTLAFVLAALITI